MWCGPTGSPDDGVRTLPILMVIAVGLLLVFVGITALVQGGLHRFAGGSSVGYTLGTTLWQGSIGDGLELLQVILANDPVVSFFLLPSFWFLPSKDG